MERRGTEYMERVRQAFLQQLPESGPSTAVINADQAPEDVTRDVIAVVDRFLGGTRPTR
jgi:dTMP kinase